MPRRPVGVGWDEPMSTPARWFTAAALLCAAAWLFAYSDPLPSPGWGVVAAAATLVLAVVGIVAAGSRRRDKGYRLSPRRPGRAVAALVLTVVATTVLCATQAPMWLRFYQARPAMLRLAAEAQRGGGGHRAVAGTYYLENFGFEDNGYDGDSYSYPAQPGYVFFDTNTAGLFTEAGYIYSPFGDPATRGGADNSRYRHLTGPWWTYAQDL